MRDYHELTELGRARRLRASVTAALEHYDLEVSRVRLITNETNGVFRIDTTGGRRYVVRVGLAGAIGHSPEQVHNEVAWMGHLAASGMELPLVVPTRAGAPFVTVEVPGVPEPRNVVVFSWIDGPLLDDRLDERRARWWGSLSAELHDLAEGFEPPFPDGLPRFDRPHPFDEPVVMDEHPLTRDRDVFRRARATVAEAIERLRVEPMVLTHGDLHVWNVKVSRTRAIPFDFEDVMWAWPVQDVATSLYYVRWDDGFEPLLSAFREGYEMRRSWPERHPDELETFFVARALVLANDVLITPEWEAEAPMWIDRFAARIAGAIER